jgi:hypothetical protein
MAFLEDPFLRGMQTDFFFPMKFKMFLNSQAINARSKQCKIQASNASLHLARPV